MSIKVPLAFGAFLLLIAEIASVLDHVLSTGVALYAGAPF